jgi:hypothetical protein
MSVPPSHEKAVKILSKMNPGFLKPAPAIPDTLFDVHLQEVFGGLGYLVTSRKK